MWMLVLITIYWSAITTETIGNLTQIQCEQTLNNLPSSRYLKTNKSFCVSDLGEVVKLRTVF